MRDMSLSVLAPDARHATLSPGAPPDALATPAALAAAPDDRARHNVYRHLADRIRLSLRVVPCEPDTPEARMDRDTAVIDIAASLNPQSHYEAMSAADAVVAHTMKAMTDAELVLCRGNLDATLRVLAQSASLSRQSHVHLSALLKLQRQRERMGGDAASQAEAAGRLHRSVIADALRGLPPAAPLPPPVPPPATLPRPSTRRLAQGTGAPDAGQNDKPAAPKILRPPAPLPPSMADRPVVGQAGVGEAGAGDAGVGEAGAGEAGANPAGANRDKTDAGSDPNGSDPADPDAPDAALPPGYAPWTPGCATPMWYTTHDDNLTHEQRTLRAIWSAGNGYCLRHPDRAQAIRRHQGPPPDATFEMPSADVIHVLLHDNSDNFTWADAWQPRPAATGAGARP
jgi:hypothetical protein